MSFDDAGGALACHRAALLSSKNMSYIMVSLWGWKINTNAGIFPTTDGVGFPAMAPEQLASVKEVAEICGVGRRTAARYVDRGDFPDPIGTLGVGRIWRRGDVERWATKMLPLPTGRPPKS